MYISKKVRENFNLYLLWGEKSEEMGFIPPSALGLIQTKKIQEKKDGHKPIERFNLRDSQGEIKPTNDIKTVEKVIIGKGLLNRHIEQRADGCASGVSSEYEIKNDYNSMPKRVRKALNKIKRKIIFQKGYDRNIYL